MSKGINGVGVGKIDIFLKNRHPVHGPMSFAAKRKNNAQNQDKQTPHIALQKLSPKTVMHPLKLDICRANIQYLPKKIKSLLRCWISIFKQFYQEQLKESNSPPPPKKVLP